MSPAVPASRARFESTNPCPFAANTPAATGIVAKYRQPQIQARRIAQLNARCRRPDGLSGGCSINAALARQSAKEAMLAVAPNSGRAGGDVDGADAERLADPESAQQ